MSLLSSRTAAQVKIPEPSQPRRRRLRSLSVVGAVVMAMAIGGSALAPSGSSIAPSAARADIAPGLVFGSLHRAYGRWYVAQLGYNYTWSGHKYCWKVWYSGPTTNGPWTFAWTTASYWC